MLYDIVIIGAGPAGLTAAIYAARSGLSPLLLEGKQAGGQVADSAEIENYPAIAHATGYSLAQDMLKQVQELGVPILYEQALSITDQGSTKTVATTAAEHSCRAVILANGAKRRKLGCPGEERFLGRGVSYCATCDGAFFRGKDVAVVGGGNTAVEDAVYLSGICRSVSLLFRRDTLTSQKSLRQTAEEKENLHLLPGTVLREIRGKDAVSSILLSQNGEEREMNVAGIFIAIGLAPDNAPFAPPLLLDEKGYVFSAEDCRTNVPGIFCAGDTRLKPLRQIVTAASDGAVAATQAERYIAVLGQ